MDCLILNVSSLLNSKREDGWLCSVVENISYILENLFQKGWSKILVPKKIVLENFRQGWSESQHWNV